MDEILTIRDIAARLKLAERTVNAMLSDRELPGFKVRGQWRVHRVHFQRWLHLVGVGRSPELATTEIMALAEDEPPAIAPEASPIHASILPSTGEGADASRGEPERGVPGPGPVQLLSERVSQGDLHRRFIEALGSAVVHHTAMDRKPLELDLTPPLPSRARVYLFNATRPPGGRPTGEHKVQLIMPGQRRGERGQFDQGGGRSVLLAGYAAEEDVFILWDAGLYADFAWSRNVQVKAETIVEAAAGRIARQERRLRPADGEPTTEILLACPAPMLPEAIQLRQDLTRARLAGL
ncbi:helix-turn-helix domain-containing protein [Mesorhizobium sp.]|uniref:helix-turn-helix domain-containing protein n=2 Tax=unclassified Mesorhizobium TaxID=325217 RepID=UPI0025F16035|nr:helix-turn-helix domain-containing protein [Mesorhizobium sp.]